MMTPKVILLFLALVCFILSAAGIPSRVNLTALGLAFWVVTQVF
jgi:hypothetical protein